MNKQIPAYWDEASHRKQAAKNARLTRERLQRREELLDLCWGVAIVVSVTGKPVKLEKDDAPVKRKKGPCTKTVTIAIDL